MIKNHKGFSILELTVTMAVIFIIATLTYPSFSDYLKYQELKNNTKKFVTHLKEAQQNTVGQQVKHGIEFDLANIAYRQKKLTQPAVIIEEYSLAEPISFASSTPFASNQVVFNPTGAVDQNGEIYLESSASGGRTKITIHPSGYVTWENN